MKTYELVCVIDAGLSSADISLLRKNVEKLVSVKDTDDMGLLPLAYPLRGQNQAYFVSYLVEVEKMDEARVELKLMKGLAKFVFYKMKAGQEFMKFSDLQKRYEDMVSAEEEKLEESKGEEKEENVEE